MAYAPEDMQQDDIRARVRDQIELIRDPARDVKGGVRPVATDTKDLADHNFLFDPGVVLVNAADIPEVNRVLAEHVRELGVEQLGDPVDQVIEDLGTYRMLDASIDFEDVRRFLSVLDVLDEELGARCGRTRSLPPRVRHGCRAPVPCHRARGDRAGPSVARGD